MNMFDHRKKIQKKDEEQKQQMMNQTGQGQGIVGGQGFAGQPISGPYGMNTWRGQQDWDHDGIPDGMDYHWGPGQF